MLGNYKRQKTQENILLFASLIEALNEGGHKAELLKAREDMLKILLGDLKRIRRTKEIEKYPSEGFGR